MIKVGYFIFSLWEDSKSLSKRLDEKTITSIIKSNLQNLSIPYKILIPKPGKYNGLHNWEKENWFRCQIIVQEPYPKPHFLNRETFLSTFKAIKSMICQIFPELEVPVTIFKEFTPSKIDQILQ